MGLYAWTNGLPDAVIKYPSETLLFGEKVAGDHHYLDLLQGEGNDMDMIAFGMHNNEGEAVGGGGANYTFCDGSVRFLTGNQSYYPINRWAVIDEWRTNTSVSSLTSHRATLKPQTASW
jgi:prepilin-type processing-associated H-X9-DG protein